MGHIVSVDANGHIVYDGLLSSQEKATVDEILNALKTEIPQIESDLETVYGKSVLYKYNLGLFLGELLSKYDVTVADRRRFWDEIKALATKEDRKRNEGVKAVTRSFYEQCYVLSQLEQCTVEKLSWRQWQDILDRVGNREDPRIFDWIKQYPEKIREDDWREFEKALHLFLKEKDTSVFEDDELFSIYDSILLMCQTWRIMMKGFEAAHPKSAKLKSKGTWAKKYYARCFQIKKEKKSRNITFEMCEEAFTAIM